MRCCRKRDDRETARRPIAGADVRCNARVAPSTREIAMSQKVRSASTKPRIAAVAATPALPHERDEAPEKGAPAQPVISQAERDLSRGLVDTDNYTRTTAIAKRAPSLRKRGA